MEYCIEASSALEGALAALAVKQDFGLDFPGVGWPESLCFDRLVGIP